VGDRGDPSRKEIEEQAILRLIALGNDPSAAAWAELAAWIALDPAYAVAFAQAELAWEQAAALKADTSGNEATGPVRSVPIGPDTPPARRGRRVGKSSQQ
jgi:ferric-dicitrate binding protein FerR (iron transport regulator)